MGLVIMNALAALLACLVTVNAVPAHFPKDKIVTYKYHADVKAGTIDAVPYASHFTLNADLQIRHDVTDPTLKNAYHTTLADVKYGLHNGPSVGDELLDVLHSLSDVTNVVQDPFLIVYDENSKFQGVKFMDTETGWSRNIKQAIASLMQLDLVSIDVKTPMKGRSFLTMENTIHGMCQVSYNVHPKTTGPVDTRNAFVVTKMHEPKNCTHFVQSAFNHVEPDSGHVEQREDMSTATTRYFEVEAQGEEILIKKLVGHGVINYLPWRARSEAHFIMTNQSLVLDDIQPLSDASMPTTSFQDTILIRDVTYVKPAGNYAQNASEDVTHGRHTVKLDVLIPKLRKMLVEAADYLDEDHLETKEPDWKHGQTINRLLYTMSYMDLGSLEQVFSVIQDTKTTKDVTVRNIFLEMVPFVGTTASCHFTRNVIRNHKVSDLTAIVMMSNLPMHVKVTSERLLLDMEALLKFDEKVSMDVKKAGILCFASLMHKTFKHMGKDAVHPLLTRYLEHFMQNVKDNPEYEMKMVYVMAMKNVRVSKVRELLAPIISGELVIPEKPHHIRIQAMWAVKKIVVDDFEFVYKLFWPVLANTKLPSSIRIVAYDILMTQMPHMSLLMNLHWLMIYEKNEYVYNYHYTTLKSLAHTITASHQTTREMARKVLRFTKVRHVGQSLSSHYIIDYDDPTYGHGEMLKTSIIRSELTGMPQAGHIEHFTTAGWKDVEQVGIHWNIEGLERILKKKDDGTLNVVSNENVITLLNQAAQDMPPKRTIHVDVCISMNGYIVVANHYDKNTWMKLLDMYKQWDRLLADWKLNWQHVTYENQYEMKVPTDMGIPAVMGTRVPNLMSLRIKTTSKKIEMDARIWKHGEYYMSVYNPIADVWHSIRRVTTHDVILPLNMSFYYNPEAKSFKMTLPRLPATKHSVAGVLMYAKNYVTVTEDENDMLKKSCATCHHYEVVTKGTAHKAYHHASWDSIDTGLQISMTIFDCEKHLTLSKHVQQLMMIAQEGHKNTWNNSLIKWVMVIRQKAMNDWISAEVGTCGQLIKIEPSIIHPTSEVEINVRAIVEDLDHMHENLHLLSNKKFNVRGTVNVKAAATETSVRTWDVNVNVDMDQGHVTNNLKAIVIRNSPGEKKLMICADGQVMFSRVGTEQMNAKMTIMGSRTTEDKCSRDGTLIILNVKGELTDDQKKHRSVFHNMCNKAVQDPMFKDIEDVHVKTWACMICKIVDTTLRKYTIHMSYKQVPTEISTMLLMQEDMSRAFWFPNVKYVTGHMNPGNVKMIVEYPMDSENAKILLFTPLYDVGYEYIDVPMGDLVWTDMMQNTLFSYSFLKNFKLGLINMCRVYPQTLITADNGTFPINLPDQWTLVSGDYMEKTFAVFVKVIRDQLWMKMFIGDNHDVEIMPNFMVEGSVTVTVDGKVLKNPEKGIMIPVDQPTYHAIKFTTDHNDYVIHSDYVQVMVLYSLKTISVILDSELQGQVTGLCGHMNGMHKEKVPKIYSLPQM